MNEQISTERLREIVDAIDYGEDTGSTSMRKDQREACRELLAIRELPEEMESADRFFTASCDCFEDGCDGTGKVKGATFCDLCDGSGEFAATSVGEETPDEIIERIKLRDAQHRKAVLAAEAERDSAQEEAARERERVDRLVPLEEENKRLREALFEIETTSVTYAEEASDVYFNQLTDIEAHAHAALNPPAATAPVCSTCNDTHNMVLRDGNAPCTHCPVPCGKCRYAGRGAYCSTTPCACECHAARAALVAK